MDPETLTSVTLIDSFQQNGVMSITLRFAFSSQERTLSKEEVQPWVDPDCGKGGQSGGHPARLRLFSTNRRQAVEKQLAFPGKILYDIV